MTTINLKEVEKKANELDNDLEKVSKAIKSIQSKKCNLLKKKGVYNYEQLLTQVLQEEQLLKEVRSLLNPKEKFVTSYTQEDVDKLDYDETIKAIKSIQSKKYHSRWLTDVEGDNDEFRNACKIEQMLLEHKEIISPVNIEYIRKSDLQTIIDTIENNKDLSQERIVELLNSLM